jgi:hypothetical protein
LPSAESGQIKIRINKTSATSVNKHIHHGMLANNNNTSQTISNGIATTKSNKLNRPFHTSRCFLGFGTDGTNIPTSFGPIILSSFRGFSR